MQFNLWRMMPDRAAVYRSGVVLWLLLAVCGMVPHMLRAQDVSVGDDPKIVSVFISQQPPYESVNASGQPEGIAISALNALFEKLHWQVRYELDSVPRGVRNLHAGVYDISTAVAPNNKINAAYLVSRVPLYHIRLVSLRRADTPPVSNVNTLRQHPFAVLSGNQFHYLEMFDVDLAYDQAPYSVTSVAKGLDMIEKGRLAYFLTYYDDALPINPALTYDVLSDRPVHIIVSRSHPDAERLIASINDALVE
ncbi:substrate-binding periplasmic protein [Alteromonas sp. CYL-A6]|uniref:substrate-binding periplasmic protein n=1 Tax=Alteromonas nitratireducens TaxID=3390813 RepID=UPI0034B85353